MAKRRSIRAISSLPHLFSQRAFIAEKGKRYPRAFSETNSQLYKIYNCSQIILYDRALPPSRSNIHPASFPSRNKTENSIYPVNKSLLCDRRVYPNTLSTHPPLIPRYNGYISPLYISPSITRARAPRKKSINPRAKRARIAPR